MLLCRYHLAHALPRHTTVVESFRWGFAGEQRGGDSGMQGVCTEVAGILEEVAEHEEEEESPELPAPASAPARFSAAVKSAMVAARAAGLNPGAAQGRWAAVDSQIL